MTQISPHTISQSQSTQDLDQNKGQGKSNLSRKQRIQKMIKIYQQNKHKYQRSARNKSNSLNCSIYFQEERSLEEKQQNINLDASLENAESVQTEKGVYNYQHNDQDEVMRLSKLRKALNAQLSVRFTKTQKRELILAAQKARKNQINYHKTLPIIEDVPSNQNVQKLNLSTMWLKSKKVKTSNDQKHRSLSFQTQTTNNKFLKKVQNKRNLEKNVNILEKFKETLFQQNNLSQTPNLNTLQNPQQIVPDAKQDKTVNKQLEEQLKISLITIKKYENKIKFLQSSVKFQKNSYSTLLGHHNNQLEYFNKKVKQLQQQLQLYRTNTKNQNQTILNLNQKLQQSQLQIQIKENQIKTINSSLLQTISYNNQRVNQLKISIIKLTDKFNSLDKQQQQTTEKNKTKSNIDYLVLQQKYKQLSKHIQMISNQEQDKLQFYIKQLFSKNEIILEQAFRLREIVSNLQQQIKQRSRIMCDMKQDIQSNSIELTHLKHKLDKTNQLLQIANNNLINKQIEIGNINYENRQTIEQLQLQNECLKEQITHIYNQLLARIQKQSDNSSVNYDMEQDYPSIKVSMDLSNRRKQQYISSLEQQ